MTSVMFDVCIGNSVAQTTLMLMTIMTTINDVITLSTTMISSVSLATAFVPYSNVETDTARDNR